MSIIKSQGRTYHIISHTETSTVSLWYSCCSIFSFLCSVLWISVCLFVLCLTAIAYDFLLRCTASGYPLDDFFSWFIYSFIFKATTHSWYIGTISWSIIYVLIFTNDTLKIVVCPFSFCDCVDCPLIYGLCLPVWYIQTHINDYYEWSRLTVH